VPKEIGMIDSKEEYIDTVLEAIVETEKKIPTIRVTYLISIDRNDPPEVATEILDLLTTFRAKHYRSINGIRYANKIMGMELSGDPRTGNFSKFK